MTPSTFPEVGTVRDVAAASTFSPDSIYRAINDGDLKAVRVGSAIRVTRFALLDWLGLPTTNGSGTNGAPTVGEGSEVTQDLAEDRRANDEQST